MASPRSPRRGWRSIDYDEIELLGDIGGGGVAVVYRGKWGSQEVAVKTLFDPKVNDALRDEYYDELQVMAELRHPNVVALLGASMTPPKLFFVMELCKRSLFDLVHHSRKEIDLQIAKDISDGMEYVHGKLIVHRDLKTANVLEGSDGSFKICDFGLVRKKDLCLGTLSYILSGVVSVFVVFFVGSVAHRSRV